VNPIFITLCVALVVTQFAVPKRFAFLPLLISTCHLPNAPVLEVGVTFTITKLLLLAGLIRAAYEGRRCWSFRQPLDVWIALWACWALCSTVFHYPRDHNPLTIRLSLVYDILGAYLYARSFLRTPEDVARMGRALALVILPVAALMLIEAGSGYNAYAEFGAPQSEIRAGSIRANGPFGHSILAGTAGAGCSILIVQILRRNPVLGAAGLVACASMVASSHSSGPLLTLVCGLAGMSLWCCRRKLRLLQVGALLVSSGCTS